MNVIEPSVKELTEKDPLKRIEIAGRICYNSLSKIQPGSAKPFVQGLIKRGHYTPLEAARVMIPIAILDENPQVAKQVYAALVQTHTNLASGILCQGNMVHCTARFMVLTGMPIEWQEWTDVKLYPEYKTFIITTDRGTANQFVRHRALCYDDDDVAGVRTTADLTMDNMPMVQESTRYCNYAKKGFSIVPPYPFAWAYGDTVEYGLWHASCEISYRAYMNLLQHGCKPQEARTVLPQSTATTVVMSGTTDQWFEFVHLRLAPDADPQARLIAAWIWQAIKSTAPTMETFDQWADELLETHNKKGKKNG